MGSMRERITCRHQAGSTALRPYSGRQPAKVRVGDSTADWIVYSTIRNVIGWLGFIGKLMQFCVEKIVGKRIDLRLDEKKRAATSFIRLYNSLQDLESICAQ